jgi:hypothetical protein
MCRVICILWGWWSWHPPVGVWIGVLGLVGVVVPLIRDLGKIGKREKAVWTIVMFVLLGLEIKSVYQDRNEHDKQQSEARDRETRSFESIANGIKGAIEESDRHFKVTSGALGQTITNTRPQAYIIMETLKPTGLAKPVVGATIPFEVDYKDTGLDLAAGVVRVQTTFVAPFDDEASQVRIGKEFDKWWPSAIKQKKGVGGIRVRDAERRSPSLLL